MRLPEDQACFRSPLLFAAGILLCITFPTLPDSVAAQVVQGHLYDRETGHPVINGNVALRDSLGAVVARTATDDDGAYELTARTPGVYWLLAVGMGYRSTPTRQFELVENEVITIDIFLHPQPLELDPLSVETRRQRMVAKLTHHGFYERQRQGFGSFLTPEQIKRWPAINVGDVLRHAPFVRFIKEGPRTTVYVRKYGECWPAIYVDGNRITRVESNEIIGALEDWVRPEDIVAVEVFRGTTQIPLQWAGHETCGVILIWTNLGGAG